MSQYHAFAATSKALKKKREAAMPHTLLEVIRKTLEQVYR